MGSLAVARLVGGLLLVSIALVTEGCFLAPWSPERPDPRAVSGPPVYAERCETCHAAQVSGQHAPSTHTLHGIRCGQCHRVGGEHPDFTRPVTDASCGGCHQAEFQQTLISQHFATRAPRALDADRAARVVLRRERFIVSTATGPRFTGDAVSGEAGGRLCAACHYDEHRLGRDLVRREIFCTGCHAGREGHYLTGVSDASNRCVGCHVRVGETVSGRVVNSHRFAMPGSEP